MRRELDSLIDEARRAEGPAARDKTSAREALARRIARGDHVALEPEIEEGSPSGGVRAPGAPRAAWVVLGAAAVAAALFVSRSTPSSKAPAVEIPAAPSLARAESELSGVSEPPARAESELSRGVSELPVRAEVVEQERSAGVPSPQRALSPLPEPPSGSAPSRAARRHGLPTSAEPPPPAALQPKASDPAANDLAAESRALTEVQRALRDGEFNRALSLLGEHDQRFARGVLLEERAAARVIASCGAGLGEVARERARAFASRYGNSPLRARVRASCEDLDRGLPEHGP